MAEEQWCTIESDPGVFTELLSAIGVRDCQVEEVYTLDKKTLNSLGTVYGLIFLFKWRSEEDNRPIDSNHAVFFANQVINNACATQAILSILMNCDDIDIGDELTKFKEFAGDLPSDIKGLAISNSELIKKAHNSFARPEPFTFTDSPLMKEDPDVYHFISYLPINGLLYELDGLKAGPIKLGDCTKQNWLDKVCPVIQKRMDRYSQSEIRFNLMALVQDKVKLYSTEIEKLNKEKEELEGETSMEVDGEKASDLKSAIDDQLKELAQKLGAEKSKREHWKLENKRRKHNYIPFIMNMLKVLAEKGELVPLLEKAKQQKAAQDAAKKQSEGS